MPDDIDTASREGAAAAASAGNPLLAPWDGPYGLAPFAALQPQHFAPAYAVAWRAHHDELDAIAANPEPPTFANTLAVFDRAGELLTRVNTLFRNLAAAETSPELQAVERAIAPLQAAHDSATYMKAALFARVDALHARRDALGLDPEQARLLDRVHLDFVRSGAQLSEADKVKLKAMNSELATLSTTFSQNLLKETNASAVIVDKS